MKSHPLAREFENNMFIQLAHRLTIEEFFEHPEIRRRPEINNNYLLVFAFAYAQTQLGWPSAETEISREVLDCACERVRALHGIGITERFSESARNILESLALPVPESIKNLHVTNELSKLDSRFSPVSRVTASARLLDALSGLTHYDNEIYRVALEEFERRLGHK